VIALFILSLPLATGMRTGRARDGIRRGRGTPDTRDKAGPNAPMRET